MKRILYGSILIFIIFFTFAFYNPLSSVKAVEEVIYLKANKDVIEKGEEIEVSFNIKEQKTIAYIANIYFDETKVELVHAPENAKVDTNQVKILWYDIQGRKWSKARRIR